jgi:6-pyruvoyl-tetrahydropterin synthase
MNEIVISRKAYFSSGVLDSNGNNFGHNFVFELNVTGELNQSSGLVINLSDVKEQMNIVCEFYDHKHLQRDLNLRDEKGELVHSPIVLLNRLILEVQNRLLQLGYEVEVASGRLYQQDKIFEINYHT